MVTVIERIRIGVPICFLAMPASCSRMGDKPPWWPEGEHQGTDSDAKCEPTPSTHPVRDSAWVNPNPSSCPKSLDDAGDSGAAAVASDVAPPTGAALSGAIRDAGQVVADMRTGFRACYQALLGERDRCASGRVDLRFQIDCEGQVRSIAARTSGLDQTMVDCMFESASGHRFEPPAGRAAVVSVPAIFVQHEERLGGPGETYDAP